MNCGVFPKWYEGKEGAEANEEDTIVNIGGSVVGTNIIIGDNNIT